jgi:Helix-turn-helix domain
MAVRNPNPRLAKIHRNYTVHEVATLYGVHPHTVREWIKRGLPTSDDKRPILILGSDLAVFLHARRTKNRQPCAAGEIYCVRCRAPRSPAGGMAEYQPTTTTLGNLVGICPCCDGLMYRRVNRTKLDQIRGALDVALPQGSEHIDESPDPSVNSAF